MFNIARSNILRWDILPHWCFVSASSNHISRCFPHFYYSFLGSSKVYKVNLVFKALTIKLYSYFSMTIFRLSARSTTPLQVQLSTLWVLTRRPTNIQLYMRIIFCLALMQRSQWQIFINSACERNLCSPWAPGATVAILNGLTQQLT